MAFRLAYRSVSVRAETSRALVDMGEHRSPKKDPDRMAPAASTGDSPMAVAMVMQMVPTVAAVPKEVPVRKDMAVHRRKASRGKAAGEISPAA